MNIRGVGQDMCHSREKAEKDSADLRIFFPPIII